MLALQSVVGSALGPPLFRCPVEGRETRFVVDDSYCEESGCEGAEVAVRLASADDVGEELRLWINLETRRARWDADLEPWQHEVARAFVRDQAVLRLLERRGQLSRAWKLSRRRVPRQAKRPAEDRLYALQEFDPRGEQFVMQFMVSGHRWAALDQYCVAPDCSCEVAVLSFYRSVEGARVDPEFAAQVDLVSESEWTDSDGCSLAPEQRRVAAAFQAEVENWREELSARRSLAREAARQCLVRHTPKTPRATGSSEPGRKVGRNERCPCGSGKKYKRCCQAANKQA